MVVVTIEGYDERYVIKFGLPLLAKKKWRKKRWDTCGCVPNPATQRIRYERVLTYIKAAKPHHRKPRPIEGEVAREA